jgi:nucleoside-diphosphate-sugar epimerase
VRGSSDTKWLEGKNITLHRCDYNSIESLEKAVQGADYVIHVAGSVAAKSYEQFREANVIATLNLAQAVINVCPDIKRFLLVSSQTATGPAQTLESPSHPDHDCVPLSRYGKSKREAEIELLKKYSELPITIIRPPAVFGPRDTAIFTVFQSIAKGLGTVIGFKPKYVTLVYVKDLARGIKQAAESEASTGKTYFLGTEKPYSWPELNKMMSQANGKKAIILKLPHALVLTLGGVTGFMGKFMKKPPVFDYEKAVDFIQPYWICDISPAKKDFGFEHTTPIDRAFKESFDWYKEQGWIK